MGHPAELLDNIAKQLGSTYPAEHFKYVYEKPLRLSDRANQPDIQVFHGEKLLCAVEIGYTRPEKLKHYKTTGVPDVRWYSKSGELIDVCQFKVPKKLEVEVSFKTDPHDVWYSVCTTNETCPAFKDAIYALWESVHAIPKERKFSRLRAASRAMQTYPALDFHEVYLRDADWSLFDDECGFDPLIDQLDNVRDCAIHKFSNGSYGFGVACCDGCDDYHLVASDDNYFAPTGWYSWEEFIQESEKQKKPAVHIEELPRFFKSALNVDWKFEDIFSVVRKDVFDRQYVLDKVTQKRYF
jgi:hypothetical protein